MYLGQGLALWLLVAGLVFFKCWNGWRYNASDTDALVAQPGQLAYGFFQGLNFNYFSGTNNAPASQPSEGWLRGISSVSILYLDAKTYALSIPTLSTAPLLSSRPVQYIL